jgi:hypothetical protein
MCDIKFLIFLLFIILLFVLYFLFNDTKSIDIQNFNPATMHPAAL